METKLLEVSFKGVDELLKLAETAAELLRQNVESAIAETTLYGVGMIANDMPVDTGRARASIAGDLGDDAGVDLPGDPQAIADGKSQSVTGFDGLEGRIGSNVEYILPLEYGHATRLPRKLTAKQLRYLFANGILKADSQGNVVAGDVNDRINRRAEMKEGVSVRDRGRYRVKGKGFFRKNIPLISHKLQTSMERAIAATMEGRSLRKGE